MAGPRITRPVPEDRAARYRAEGWWDSRVLRDGIEASAQARPARVALVDDERSWTCEELAAAVARCTAALAARGVGPGAPIVLVTGNVGAGVIVYHAAIRAGAITAVLDRRCGPADLRAARAALGAGVVVVPRAERARLVDVDDGAASDLEDVVGGTAPGEDWPEPDRDAPTTVLFTSGTTGRPKGVVHSLNTLTAGAANMARITGADEDTVLFLVSPLASITGVMQVHLAADRHATLVLEDRFDPERSLARIDAQRATLLGGAPVIAERLLRAAEARGTRTIALRTLALGGSMLPLPLLELATDHFGIEVARIYGSSEAPNATGSLPSDPRARRLGDDGALMPGTEVRVGSSSHPEEGLLQGPGVFLGYLDDEDNEEAFEDGWYRTGDAVEVHGGRVTVIGRIKDVVNRNGLKLSPSEIDAALATLARAVELSCFGVADPDTGERLAVAVRPVAGAAITLGEVCAHLVEMGIATRKLPEQLVVWDEPLPRTASGKIVRSRLVMESPAKPNEYAARVTRVVS